jgi:hypothetical protein
VPNLNSTRRLVQPASPLCTARRSSARGRDRGGPLVAHQHHHPARAAVESHREQWAGGAQASLRPSRSAFGPWSSCVVGWGMGSWAPAAWVVGAPLRWQGSSSGAAAVAVAAAGLLETVTGPCQCLCVCVCVHASCVHHTVITTYAHAHAHAHLKGQAGRGSDPSWRRGGLCAPRDTRADERAPALGERSGDPLPSSTHTLRLTLD